MFHLSPVQCIYCNNHCIKKGLYRQVQKFYCKQCKKYQRLKYTYRLTSKTDDHNIALLTKECMSISSISRYLLMPKTTVCRRILRLSKSIHPPAVQETNQVYEVDEMYVLLSKKNAAQTYVSYALNKLSKIVIGFVIGGRRKEIIGKLITNLLALNPRKIYTDGLNIYPSLIPPIIHRCFRYKTNTIERNNLSIRNSLKRLSRKTICFSRSALMLEACLKILFWY